MPYTLKTIQQEYFKELGISPYATLQVLTSLYEKRLITYPKTTSCYLNEQQLEELPRLISTLQSTRLILGYARFPEISKLSKKYVDDKKALYSHGIIITGVNPVEVNKMEYKIYEMIAARMLEAFSQRCVKETITTNVAIKNRVFQFIQVQTLQTGWQGILNKKEYQHEHETLTPTLFQEKELLEITAYGITGKKIQQQLLYTEASLLDEPIADSEIVHSLLNNKYIKRSEDFLIPTEKGMFLYENIKHTRIADWEMAESWEKSIADIANHKIAPESVLKALNVYTIQATKELLNSKLK